MALTKPQLLNKLTNLKDKQPKGSVKYISLGMFKILVFRDLISPDDVLLEFPELDQG